MVGATYTVWEYERLSGSPLWKDNGNAENWFFFYDFQVIDWSNKPVYQKEIPPTFSYLWEIILPHILNPGCNIKLYGCKLHSFGKLSFIFCHQIFIICDNNYFLADSNNVPWGSIAFFLICTKVPLSQKSFGSERRMTAVAR